MFYVSSQNKGQNLLPRDIHMIITCSDADDTGCEV